MKFLKFEEFLNEGVHDKNALKAVFIYGGPGSGKSYIATQLFGVPEQGLDSLSSSTGLKVINLDTAFEVQLKKLGIPLDSLNKMSQDEFNAVTMGDDSPRGKAAKIYNKQRDFYQSGRLGLIISGTGKTMENVKADHQSLTDLGYDCFCIYVNVPLDIAKQRNSKRDRKLPDELVDQMWHASQNNIGKMQNLFGPHNFVVVDNHEVSKTNEIVSKVQKRIQEFLRRPIENRIGKSWMDSQKKKIQEDLQSDPNRTVGTGTYTSSHSDSSYMTRGYSNSTDSASNGSYPTYIG